MPRPLDPTQFRWWHRIRRRSASAFIVGAGAIGASALIACFTMIGWVGLLGVPFNGQRLLVMFVALAPLHGLLFAWTWSYMERRYAATLGVMCAGCGYDLRGAAGPRCPECGEPLPGGRADHERREVSK